ncbi:MAG TPA: GNAT family N-acetyltransferase [Mycobacteriales bacterium]|jgi:ribosomal protein S18 acetylase RimI-like enzyme|nr:GNAT family N-acetyltransferase [Mycobacteriales bacterium]
MNEAVTVTPAKVLDEEVVSALGALLPQLSSSARADRQLLVQLIEHDATTLYLARARGRVVGALTLVTYPLPTGLRAHIEDVVVDQSARGLGIGEALVRTALAAVGSLGAKSVDLTSRPSREAAIGLYTRVGFTRRDSHTYRYTPDRPEQNTRADPNEF